MQDNTVVDITKYQQKNDLYAYTGKKVSGEKQAEILDEVKKNKSRWWNAFNLNIATFRQDKLFYTGQSMWPDQGTKYRNLGKIPYTFNLLKPIVRQLQGEISSMQPSITLSSQNFEKTDPSMVVLMTDFLRGEMYHAKAADAYNECFINQCVGGWGVLELSTDYVDEFSFDQEVNVTSSPDPLLVGFDPSAKLKTKADGTFQYKDYFMDKEDFKATYHRDPPANAQMLGGQWEFIPLFDSDQVIITDYYRMEYKTKMLVQLTNNENYSVPVLEKDVPVAQEHYMQLMTQQGMMADQIPPLVIANKRRTKIGTIHCYKCVWDAVLEHKIWPAKYFPFVFVDANSTTQDGRQLTESFIRAARDAQTSYNYTMSEIYNGLARCRREQVWLTRTMAKGHEEFLRNPDRQQSHCEFNFDPQVPQGPIFRPPEELPQTLFMAAQNAKQGVYDALGMMPVAGSELPNNIASATVGRIITQGNLTFAKLLNNLFDGMQQVGEVFLDLVPKIYDVERIINVVDATGAGRPETINTQQNGQPKNMLENLLFHLQVKPIAAFAIQQQELRQNLMQIATLNPANPALMSDLIASTLDTPIAPLLVARLKTLIPPNVTLMEKGEPVPPAPPPPQIQLIQAQINKLHTASELDQAKAQAAQSKATQQNQQLQQKNAQDAANYQLEEKKLIFANNELAQKSQKAILDNETELHKAQLDHDAKVIPALMQKNEPPVNAR